LIIIEINIYIMSATHC